jgi:hypothetical protein
MYPRIPSELTVYPLESAEHTLGTIVLNNYCSEHMFKWSWRKNDQNRLRPVNFILEVWHKGFLLCHMITWDKELDWLPLNVAW